MSILYVPQIDAVIGNLKSDPDLTNQKIHLGLMGIYASFISIKPFGDDDIRQIWIEAERGPVEAGLVFRAEDYLYSSAADYAGEKGILEDVVVIW